MTSKNATQKPTLPTKNVTTVKPLGPIKTEKPLPPTRNENTKKKTVWQALFKFTRKKDHDKR